MNTGKAGAAAMTAADPDAGIPSPCGGMPAQTSPPARPPQPGGTQRAAAGQAPAAAHPGSAVTPPAEPGTPSSPPSHPSGPLPGTEGTQDPAGGALDADDAPSAGTSGEQFRRQWKTARAGRNYGRRRARFKRAAAQPGPGMIRRPPPGGDAA